MPPKQPKGLIKFYGLSDWYIRLSEEQREKLKYYYSLGMNKNPETVDRGDIWSSSTSQNFLSNIGSNAIGHKDYQFAELVLLKALEVRDSNSKDIHFVFNGLINLYYKQRNTIHDAIEKCVDFCLRDINSIEGFIDSWREEMIQLGVKNNDVVTPRIPSFERLSIIYEKQGNYLEAIKICKKAIELKLRDSTKGGFSARLASLEKKSLI